MIRVLICRNLKGQIHCFRVEGHAGFDEPGRDLVCCAVSCIVQTAILGLTDVIGVEPLLDKKSGLVDCRIPEEISANEMEKVSVVMDTMLAGLKSIELEYDEYITILER